MTASTPTAGVVPLFEGDSGHAPLMPDPPPATAGHAIRGPAGIIGLNGRRAAGLALRLAKGADDDELFEIAIVDEAGAVAQVLGPYPTDDVVAVWRAIAGASGLALLVQDPEGVVSAPYPQLGPLRLGTSRMRRRVGLLNHRRPRFLTRRKPGALPVSPRVFRDARLSVGVGA